jgi:hypothetical protein
MTSILLAAVLLQQDPAGAEWGPKPPYKDSESTKYAVKMNIDDPSSGTQVAVEMNTSYKIAKKTDKGYEGTFGWTQLMVEGAEQPDEEFKIVLKPNGFLKTVDSSYGPGMRRMLLPFFFSYPEKPLAPGATWKYKDDDADKTDAHMCDFEYKLEGTEMYKSKKAQKVLVKFNEIGPDPLKGSGTYWVNGEGRVVKFELSVTGWTVPVAGQIFTAKINGELTG